MLSGISRIYDPDTGGGQIGRNFSHQTTSTALGFFDKAKYIFNPFIASGAIGMCIDEFNGDNLVVDDLDDNLFDKQPDYLFTCLDACSDTVPCLRKITTKLKKPLTLFSAQCDGG